jgi:hypothetical protein
MTGQTLLQSLDEGSNMSANFVAAITPVFREARPDAVETNQDADNETYCQPTGSAIATATGPIPRYQPAVLNRRPRRFSEN